MLGDLHSRVRQVIDRTLWYVFVPVVIFVVSAPITFPFVYAIEGRVDGALTNYESDSEDVTSNKQVKGAEYSFDRQVISVDISDYDYIVVVIEKFLERYNSPLVGMGDVFVAACDKYDAPFDCTTVTAIAHVETALCTYKPSQAQKNCWGFGGSGENRIVFDSYEDGIYYVTERLVNGYGPEYMLDPVKMQYTYCGSHCDKWGGYVQAKRIEQNNIAIELGFPPLF